MQRLFFYLFLLFTQISLYKNSQKQFFTFHIFPKKNVSYFSQNFFVFHTLYINEEMEEKIEYE